MRSGDLGLEALQFFIPELQDLSALGANHVIVVLSQVPVFVSHLAVVESVFLRKSEPAHQLQGVPNKIGRKGVSVIVEYLNEFTRGDVVLDLEKNLENRVPALKLIDMLLLEEFLELFFFLVMNPLHRYLVGPGRS